jgi:Clathrin adaptor complex small chain
VKLKGEVYAFLFDTWLLLIVKVHRLIAPRDQKHQSNFVEFRQTSKVVYRRYAGLFFCACVDTNDNELAYLEAIHFFVEVLDAFFGNVCELDLVFNFYKVRLSLSMNKQTLTPIGLCHSRRSLPGWRD